MPRFEYTVLDLQGRSRQGVISADSVQGARAQLEQRQWVPVRVDAAATTATAMRAARFSGKDLVLFTRQLATLVETAPLEEALRTIGSQSERRGVRRVTIQTHALVVEGFRLSDAMARQGNAFPPLYRAMVAMRRKCRRLAAGAGAAGRSAGTPGAGAQQVAVCVGLPGGAGTDHAARW